MNVDHDEESGAEKGISHFRFAMRWRAAKPRRRSRAPASPRMFCPRARAVGVASDEWSENVCSSSEATRGIRLVFLKMKRPLDDIWHLLTDASTTLQTYACPIPSRLPRRRAARFYAGELDRVELIYTQFNSMISFTPTLRTLIPLLPSGMEMEGDEMSAPASMRGLRTGIW